MGNSYVNGGLFGYSIAYQNLQFHHVLLHLFRFACPHFEASLQSSSGQWLRVKRRRKLRCCNLEEDIGTIARFGKFKPQITRLHWDVSCNYEESCCITFPCFCHLFKCEAASEHHKSPTFIPSSARQAADGHGTMMQLRPWRFNP